MDGRAFIDLLSGRSGAASPAAQNGAAVGDGNGAAVKGTAGGDAADADGRPVAVLPDGWVRRPGGVRWHHAVMNLPGSAVSFLSAFRGACRCSDAWPPGATMPLIHVYTFQKRETHAGAAPLAASSSTPPPPPLPRPPASRLALRALTPLLPSDCQGLRQVRVA